MTPLEKTKEFLAISDQFRLGHLTTESFHSVTMNLSSELRKSPESGLALLKEVDRLALEKMKLKESEVYALSVAIQDTFKRGGRVFMCGCGATGRLSLVLETLMKKMHPTLGDKVLSFMAGGDYALIKSVESFEDKVDYGERQLQELGFREGDFLIASTEGGETPFVIGAVLHATTLSKIEPYFLYCNPDEDLKNIHRSFEVIQHPKIKKLNLTTGPMAISGSTRMQASTVMTLAIGASLLFTYKDRDAFHRNWSHMIQELLVQDYSVMADLVKAESKIYQDNEYVNYVCSHELGISLLTDTTERSPTFSLRSFESPDDLKQGYSLCYLFLSEQSSAEGAWFKLLEREPRALNWSHLDGKINIEKLHHFDISSKGEKLRSAKVPTHSFYVKWQDDQIHFELGNCQKKVDASDLFLAHLKLKVLMNAHSTAIMGLLGRYEGNIMTWVRPSNLKLIDRSSRYIMKLCELKGRKVSYEEVVLQVFTWMEKLEENEPIVQRVLKEI